MLTITPTTTPRIGKRELRVITGIASHERVGWLGPPLNATAPPNTRPLPIHAPNINSSGRATRGIKRSAVAKHRAAGIRNSAGHQPVSYTHLTLPTKRIV